MLNPPGRGNLFAAAGFLESFRWGVSSSDPLTLFSVLIVLPLMTSLAAAHRAWWAARVDPLELLRVE
ncbi:MAG: hypothetical protein IH968_17810 [Gemmatimonadetes bacterium]|nr:hypothetical protein [Gemmatimonadota bacterium]